MWTSTNNEMLLIITKFVIEIIVVVLSNIVYNTFSYGRLIE